MAGDERIMNDSSLLMIHNAWSFCEGNAKELRKQADDLDKITRASVVAYKAHSNLSEDEIAELMDNESWILPDEAIEYGFATGIEKTKQKSASQNARRRLLELVKIAQEADSGDEGEEPDEDNEDSPEDEKPAEPPEDTEEKSPDEKNPEDDSNADPEEDGEDETEDNQKEAAQRMSGFFNAFFNYERRMKNEH
jgi:ATP-dependent Clp protease protease subunit